MMIVDRLRAALRRVGLWGWLGLAVFALGSFLRVEHALTFDHVNRASDIEAHLAGVAWTREHWAPFYFSETAYYQARSYPPLWYFASALILETGAAVRWLAALSLFGWVSRHLVLWRILVEAIPQRPWARLSALTIHAILPIGVLVDGKINPEAFHSGIFALALYALWRMERQSQTTRGMSVWTALIFGVLSGLALLAKITAALLLVVATLVFGWRALVRLRRFGLSQALVGVVAPAGVAALGFAATAGFWVATNLSKFGHPFPHVWDMEGTSFDPALVEPVLYRRPLAWILPFEWNGYWDFPMLRTPWDPRPNFWATELVGTWSDINNRGFCRLEGGTITDYVWGARNGFLDMGSDAWWVNSRCIEHLATMSHLGLWIAAVSVAALFYCLFRHLRTWGARESLAMALLPILLTLGALRFALTYPFDHIAVLNPRYLLSQSLPMSACLGFALGGLEAVAARRAAYEKIARSTLALTFGAIVVMGAMVVFERFGR